MKRPLTVTVLVLTVVLLLSAPAAAQTSAQRGYPAKVTSKSKPKVDKKSPFKFKVTGAITLPSRACAPGATPGTGATNCIPLNCAPGVTNTRYCGVPTLAQICTGKVRLQFKKGSKTVKTKTVNLNAATCKYSASVTIKDKKGRKAKLRGVKLKVTARFMGNAVLKARNAKTFKVTAGKKRRK